MKVNDPRIIKALNEIDAMNPAEYGVVDSYLMDLMDWVPTRIHWAVVQAAQAKYAALRSVWCAQFDGKEA